MAEKVLDKHVRTNLHEYLLKGEAGKPDAVIIDELVLQRKDGRADVAVVNDYLHCYEIKSDADKLSRLKRQVRVYGKVFDYLSVVVTEKHLALATKAVPKFWGVYCWFPKSPIFERAAEVCVVREPTPNLEVQVAALSQLLWKDSALELLKEVGITRGWLTKPKWKVWKHVQENCTQAQIHAAVITQLKTHRRLASVA